MGPMLTCLSVDTCKRAWVFVCTCVGKMQIWMCSSDFNLAWCFGQTRLEFKRSALPLLVFSPLPPFFPQPVFHISSTQASLFLIPNTIGQQSLHLTLFDFKMYLSEPEMKLVIQLKCLEVIQVYTSHRVIFKYQFVNVDEYQWPLWVPYLFLFFLNYTFSFSQPMPSPPLDAVFVCVANMFELLHFTSD